MATSKSHSRGIEPEHGSQRPLDRGEGVRIEFAEPAEQSAPGHGTNRAGDRGTLGVDPGGRRNRWPQPGRRARTRKGDDDDQLVFDPGNELIRGEDDRGPVLARLTFAGGAERDQPDLTRRGRSAEAIADDRLPLALLGGGIPTACVKLGRLALGPEGIDPFGPPQDGATQPRPASPCVSNHRSASVWSQARRGTDGP